MKAPIEARIEIDAPLPGGGGDPRSALEALLGMLVPDNEHFAVTITEVMVDPTWVDPRVVATAIFVAKSSATTDRVHELFFGDE